jgi:hypothetical protein
MRIAMARVTPQSCQPIWFRTAAHLRQAPRDSRAADERDELAPVQLIELHRGIAWRTGNDQA